LAIPMDSELIAISLTEDARGGGKPVGPACGIAKLGKRAVGRGLGFRACRSDQVRDALAEMAASSSRMPRAVAGGGGGGGGGGGCFERESLRTRGERVAARVDGGRARPARCAGRMGGTGVGGELENDGRSTWSLYAARGRPMKASIRAR